MRPFRWAVLVLGLATFLATPPRSGADDEKPRRPERGRFPGRFGDFRPSLLPRGAEEKLSLNSEQKEKLAAIQKEFDEKFKEKFGKVRDEVRKAFEDRDREAIRKAMEKMQDIREDARKLREEYQTRAEAVLTDTQKKQLAELRREGSPRGREGRPPERGQSERPAPGGVSPRSLEGLGLTDEQKEKIAKLRKEFESKVKEVLTEEQRKKLEELEKSRPGDREGPRRRGRRPADI